ncbi:MAG: Uma2 family endonuclease [Armatimonadetes bacterium]|nr:Uma2 family endonuclease [Armatimonadota bacterium]
MTALLEPILRSPALERHIEDLLRVRDEERRLREQFLHDMADDRKMEFINGEVIVHSPATLRHCDAVLALVQLLNAHVRSRKLGRVASEKLLVSLTRNDYEPDVCYYGPEKAQGLEPKEHRFPAPDMVVEVLSPSTEERDRGVKMEDYAEHGTGEYWIVDPDAETIEQYLLRDGAYDLSVKVREGTITSTVVPGFTIPVRAVFDAEENLAALKRVIGA